MWVVSGYDKNKPVNMSQILTVEMEGNPIDRGMGASFFVKFVAPGSTENIVWSYSDVNERNEEYKSILKQLKIDK